MTDALDSLVLAREVEAFLYREARLLDEARFEDWMALFTDDAAYWVPARPDQDNPLDTISIIYDDRRMMETRVKRLRHPAAHAQAPASRTKHLIANVMIEAEDAAAGEIEVSAGFLMLEFRDDRQRVYGGGVRHRLRRVGGALRIAWKRVDLVDCDGVHDGIVVPF